MIHECIEPELEAQCNIKLASKLITKKINSTTTLSQLTKEQINEYIKISYSFYEVILRMKRDGYAVNPDNYIYIKYLRRQVQKYNIDTSHMRYNATIFRHITWCIPKEEFNKYVEQSNSMKKLAKKIEEIYNSRPSNPVLYNRINIESIDISHMKRKNNNKVCNYGKKECRECKHLFDKTKKIDNRIICSDCKNKKEKKECIMTLGELKKHYNNNKDYNAIITEGARKIYFKSDRKISCEACDYDIHIEICHIKGSSTFSDDTTIKYINHIDNLVALCPNCHLEFDKGITPFDKLCPNIKPIYSCEQYPQKVLHMDVKRLGKTETTIDNYTKAILFDKYGYRRAKCIIGDNARKKYKNALKYRKCNCCHYDKHYEICHIKAVADFDDNALLKDINSPDNLIALCRNHHKELDRNVKTLDELCSETMRKMNDEKEKQLFEANKVNIKYKTFQAKFKVRKIKNRPTLDQINIDLKELGSYVKVGKKYGVTDNAIRKWIDTYKQIGMDKVEIDMDKIEISNNQSRKSPQKKNFTCQYCNIKICKTKTNSCYDCYQIHKKTGPRPEARKVKNRPSLEQLYEDLEKINNYTNIAKKYNVHSKTIKNWISEYEQSLKSQ
jgi:transposase-like protein